VIEAADGITGLDIAIRERPDLVLLDIFMPKMDGVTMLSHLRQDTAWGKTASVLVLTNSTDAETIAKVTGLGAADFLIKSEWSLVELVDRIRKELIAKTGKKSEESTWTNPAIG
jgi:DNA-binding response OmpR family regulator